MKNAIVIGGLSEHNYHVHIGDITVDESNQSDHIHYVDAASEKSVAKFRSTIEGQIQHLDALIITVGAIDEGSIINIGLEKWKWIFNINLFSSINLVDAFLPLLEKSEKAKIMLTGSGSGFGEIDEDSGLGLYAISKHAHVAYFKGLGSELAKKDIQVSLLIPSAINGKLAENSAKMRQDALKEEYAEDKGSQPKGRKLEDPLLLGVKFVKEFLNGKVIITNNPLQLKEKFEKDYVDLNENLK